LDQLAEQRHLGVLSDTLFAEYALLLWSNGAEITEVDVMQGIVARAWVEIETIPHVRNLMWAIRVAVRGDCNIGPAVR
jgi:hypothetical protein